MTLVYLQAFLVNLAAGTCIAILTTIFVKKKRKYVIVLTTIIISLLPTSYALFVMGTNVPRVHDIVFL
jgi:CHASE2 domain-containing sensor protein